MSLLHLYRIPALSNAKKNELLSILQQKISPEVEDIQTEYCFNIEITQPLTQGELAILHWLLSETFEPDNFSDKSFLIRNTAPPSHPPPSREEGKGVGESLGYGLCALSSVFEVGPRMNFSTAWSTNAVSVCHACGLNKIMRIERSRRYKFIFSQKSAFSSQELTDYYSSLITHHC